MSWLSKILGLDNNKPLLNDINAVGNAVITGIEVSSPIAATLINAVEAVGNAPTNPITVTSSVGTILSVFDPTLIVQLEAKTNAGIAAAGLKYGIPETAIADFEAEIDAMESSVLSELGVPNPTTPAAT